MISIIVLSIVFVLIAVRQLGRIRLQIWQVMLFGAVAVLVTGQISPLEALKAINLDVMLFLFGVFIVGQALEESGYLSHLSYLFFRRAGSVSTLVLYILFGMGMLSALARPDLSGCYTGYQHGVEPACLECATGGAVFTVLEPTECIYQRADGAGSGQYYRWQSHHFRCCQQRDNNSERRETWCHYHFYRVREDRGATDGGQSAGLLVVFIVLLGCTAMVSYSVVNRDSTKFEGNPSLRTASTDFLGLLLVSDILSGAQT